MSKSILQTILEPFTMFSQGASEIQTLYLMNPNFALPHFIPDDSSNNLSSIDHAKNVITGSKYLKAARELLDEIASVANRDKAKMMIKESTTERTDQSNGGRPELTTAQRQDIQMKKSTLNIMLDEVEQRCKQYHQQMQMIEASFERVSGAGSAKPYTHLARKTITKHFSRLKNAISAQTKALGKTLGEEENESRLRFVGMMQPSNNANSWRPQRCLPEKAVLLLRAWLFGHFLHPYPKDSDKQMLAKQTGLTRSQVSNWFINARVRLWKPMVEEMYLEEMTKTYQEHISPNDNTFKTEEDCMDSKSSNHFPMQTTKRHRYENHYSSPSRILSDDDITFIRTNQGQSPGSYLSSSGYDSTYGISVVESSQPRQIPSGFQGNNNFSLSLAPPPLETYSRKSNFLSRGSFEFETRIEGVNGIDQAEASHPNVGNFEILDFQLLHDHRFVV